MADPYSILNPPEEETKEQEPVILVACADCGHQCSSRAETCPSCGRFFRSYKRIYEVTPGAGWSTAVGWGVILGWVFAIFIVGCLIFILFVLGVLTTLSLGRP